MLYGMASKIRVKLLHDNVLILIFLENALRRDGESIESHNQVIVLILIFLENALRHQS